MTNESRTPTPDDAPHRVPTDDSVDASTPVEMLDDFASNAFMLPSDVEALDEDFDSPDESPHDNADDHASESDDHVVAPVTPHGRKAGHRPPPANVAGPSLPLRPMNLNLLTSLEASLYWRDLDAWVTWLRRDYGLGITVIPPLWHRHAELRWELSALHTAWLAAYDPKASASAPVTWHRELVEAHARLAERVAHCGTGLTEDRPTQITLWPGEAGFGSQETWDSESVRPRPVTDRAADFEAWVAQDIAARCAVEAQVRAEYRRPVPGTMPRPRTGVGRP